MANDNIRLHITADVEDKTGNSIKTIQGNLKEIPAEVTTKVNVDGKQAKKDLKDINGELSKVNKEVDAKVNLNAIEAKNTLNSLNIGLDKLNGKEARVKVNATGTQALNTINGVKKSLSELPKSVSTKIEVNAQEAKSQLDSIKKAINSISKDISTTVKLNHKQADTSIESYKKKLKDITAPIETNTKVRLDTRSALASLNNLNAKLKELKDSDLKLKFSVEGAAAIKALSNGIQSFNKSADAANRKLDRLKNISEILGKIEKNVGINVSINGADETSNKLKEIYGLLKGIREYSNVKINANANVNGGSPRVPAQPQGSNRSGSNLGSYESQLRGIVAKAEQAHMRGDAQELAKLRQEYVLTTQEMLNFQRQFGNGDYNNAIKKLTPIVQTLQRLGIIARDDLGPIRELNNMQFNWDAQMKASTPRTYKQMAQTEKELAEYARQNGNLAESDNHLRNAARLEAEARSINTALEVQRTLQGNIEQTLKEQIKSLEKIAAEQRMQGDTRNLAYTEARLRQLKQEEQLAKARQNPDAYKGLMQEANVYKEQLANPTLTPEARRQLYTQIINTVSNATRQGLRDGMIDNRQAASNYQKLMPYARELGVENNLQNEITRLGGTTNNVGGQQANNARNEYNDLKRQAVQAIEDINRAWRAGSGTEEEERRLDNILNRMRQIKREAGTLNQSTEANLYTTLANGTQRGSRGYGILTERANQARRDSQELRADTGAGTDRNTPFGSKENIFAYAIRFIGRSSKGTGSAMEAMAQLMKDVQPLQGASGLTGIMARAVPMTGVISAALLAFEKAIELAIQGVQTFSNILIQLGTTIYNALKPGIELYKNQTSATFSFGASLLSNGYDENGNQLGKSLQNKNDIFGTSRELVNRASIDAEMSAFSLDDILRSLQGTLPVLMQKGMSLDQAYDVNKGVAGVSKMIQLSPSQILQETRDLAQGSITARGSQVANALGVNNEDLAGKSADEIWELLMEKFQNYSEMLTQFEDTAMGRAQQLDERLSMVGKTFVEQLAGGFKSIAEYIIKFTGQYVDNDENGNQTAHLDSISGHWYSDEEGEEGTDLGTDYKPQNAEFNLSEPFQEAADILKQIIIYIADAIDEVIDFVDNTSNLSDPLSTGESIIELIIDGLVTCVEFLIGCVDAAISFAKGLEWAIPLLSVIGKLCKSIWAILKAAINLTIVLVKSVLAAIDEVLSAIPESIRTKLGLKVNIDGDVESIKSSLGDVYSDLGESVAPWTDTPVSRTWKQMLGLNNAPNGRIGTLGTLIREGFARGDGVPKRGSGPRMSQVNGNPSPTDKDAKAAQRAADKANREAIKESQKMLKAKQQELKEILEDTLDRLKDLLEKNEVAYKEGFTSLEDYLKQKIELEKGEAEARLKEAYEEKAAIENSLFPTLYDKEVAIHKNNRDIQKYTKALQKVAETQVAVAQATIGLTQAFNKFSNSDNETENEALEKALGKYFPDINAEAVLNSSIKAINTSGNSSNTNVSNPVEVKLAPNGLPEDWQPKEYENDVDKKFWELSYKMSQYAWDVYKKIVNPGVFRGMMQIELGDELDERTKVDHNYTGLVYDENYTKYGTRGFAKTNGVPGYFAKFENDEDFIKEFFKTYVGNYIDDFANASYNGQIEASVLKKNGYFEEDDVEGYGKPIQERIGQYDSWHNRPLIEVFNRGTKSVDKVTNSTNNVQNAVNNLSKAANEVSSSMHSVGNNSNILTAEENQFKYEADLGMKALEAFGSNDWYKHVIDEIINEAVAQDVEPALAVAIAKNESGFEQSAISPVGAIGIGQLMPDTAAGLNVDPYDRGQNIKGMIKYIKMMLEQFNGDIRKAVAAYNAGPAAVKAYNGVPPYSETQAYVENVLSDRDAAISNGYKLFGADVQKLHGINDKLWRAQQGNTQAVQENTRTINGIQVDTRELGNIVASAPDNPDIEDASGATKLFMQAVGNAWHNLHPELSPLEVSSGYRAGDTGSHHYYGEAFDVVNDYFDDSNLREEYVNLINTLGGKGLSEWTAAERAAAGIDWATGSNIHATTPQANYGNGGIFSASVPAQMSNIPVVVNQTKASPTKEANEAIDLINKKIQEIRSAENSWMQYTFGIVPNFVTEFMDDIVKIAKLERIENKTPMQLKELDDLKKGFSMKLNMAEGDWIEKIANTVVSHMKNTSELIISKLKYGVNGGDKIDIKEMIAKYVGYWTNPINVDEYSELQKRLVDEAAQNQELFNGTVINKLNDQIKELTNDDLKTAKDSSKQGEVDKLISERDKKVSELPDFIRKYRETYVAYKKLNDEFYLKKVNHEKIPELEATNEENMKKLAEAREKASNTKDVDKALENAEKAYEESNKALKDAKEMDKGYEEKSKEYAEMRTKLYNMQNSTDMESLLHTKELAKIGAIIQNGKWRPVHWLDAYERAFLTAQDLGNSEYAEKLQQGMLKLKQELFGILDNFIKTIEDRFSTMQNLFDNLPQVTNLQKEFGDKLLNAYKNQELYEANKQMRDSLEQMYMTTSSKIEGNKQSINDLKIRQQLLLEQKKADDSIAEKIHTLEADNELKGKDLIDIFSKLSDVVNNIKLNKVLAESTDELKELRKTAKQALEDGLVTFLTNGVNEAGSLKEAFGNMILGFLKTMQEFFAKRLVYTLMNRFFSTTTEELSEKPVVRGDREFVDDKGIKYNVNAEWGEKGIQYDKGVVITPKYDMVNNYQKDLFTDEVTKGWTLEQKAFLTGNKDNPYQFKYTPLEDTVGFKSNYGLDTLKDIMNKKSYQTYYGKDAEIKMLGLHPTDDGKIDVDEDKLKEETNAEITQENTHAIELLTERAESLGEKIDALRQSMENILNEKGYGSISKEEDEEIDRAIANGDVQESERYTQEEWGKVNKEAAAQNVTAQTVTVAATTSLVQQDLSTSKYDGGIDRVGAELVPITGAVNANTMQQAEASAQVQQLNQTAQESNNKKQEENNALNENTDAIREDTNDRRSERAQNQASNTPTNIGTSNGVGISDYSSTQGSGIGYALGAQLTSLLQPITQIITSITGQISGFLNSGVFQQLLVGITNITGSAGAQLAGSIYAIKTLFNGDTKEKLLSMLYLELQLIYLNISVYLPQIVACLPQIIAAITSMAAQIQSAMFASSMPGSSVYGHATGGHIVGEGTSTSDSIPAMLSNGEYVIKANSVKKYGLSFMNAVNNGSFSRIPVNIAHFADGGAVDNLAMQETARGMSTFAGRIGTQVSNTTNMSVALVGNKEEAIEHFMRSPRGQKIMLDFNKDTARFTNTITGRY